jgi:hypothetical protein
MILILPLEFHRAAARNPRNFISRQRVGSEDLTEHEMADNNAPKAGIGIILGGILVLSAAFFILTGGELGGKKQIKGDSDLPPVASPKAPPAR